MLFQVCMTCVNIKEDNLNNAGDQTVSAPNDLHMDKNTWRSMGTEAVWSPTFLKKSGLEKFSQ